MTTPAQQDFIEQWAPRLRDAVTTRCRVLRSVSVIAETPSTQTCARQGSVGEVHVACRQTAGRGRLGRPWADTGDEGVALSFAIDRMEPEHLAIASAVGVARAIESILGRLVGIKWPNDIMIDGRKLAGILIELTEDRAIIGIGVNVHQTQWPAELRDRAVSLAQVGGRVERIEVVEAVIVGLDRALRLGEAEVVDEFAARDTLTGQIATLRNGNDEVTGRVLRVEPTRGLVVDAGGEERWLPAATTSVLDVRG